MKKFTLIGGGSWGTAIACLIARAQDEVLIYSIEPEITNEINTHHTNTKYLGNAKLPVGLKATSQIEDIIDTEILVIAAPSHAFSSVLQQLKDLNLPKETTLLIATKGLCEDPVELFSTKIERELTNTYAFLSGPNFAREVADDKLSAIVISSKDLERAKQIASLLQTDTLTTDVSDDVITAQIASIVKNITAIKSGIFQAQGHGANARAWLISKALEEIATISKQLGGDASSLPLSSIVGDLVLTCYSDASRNTKFGYEFHKSNYSKEFLDNYPILVEGARNAKLLQKFVGKYNLDLPITSSVADILKS